jgi:hypothetical protein
VSRNGKLIMLCERVEDPDGHVLRFGGKPKR